jgi:hypothetical protein
MNLLILLAALLISSQASAWGKEGHELVCAIAEENLTEKAADFVRQTLALGEFLDGNTKNDLASLCTWADKAKYGKYTSTYEAHFLNVPADKNKIDFGRDCAALDCIAVAIQRNLSYLNSPAGSKREKSRKAAALRFLGHFVGDIHQPLHVSNREDWGGNKIRLTWFGEKTNLHKMWDVNLLEKAGLNHPGSLEFLLNQTVDDDQHNVLKWMEESFALSRKYAYLNVENQALESGDNVGQAYFERAKPIIIQQLTLAGHRLAYLLNALADGSLDTNFLID